jgi:hypothetical protein
MESLNNVTVVLIDQHRGLQKCLGETKDLTQFTKPELSMIISSLKSFNSDLLAHRHLEEEVFYPELLRRMKADDLDTFKTTEFIKEMEDIGVLVAVFLAKYLDDVILEKKLIDFIEELDNITETLNIRIESEEAGVYGYWEALQTRA